MSTEAVIDFLKGLEENEKLQKGLAAAIPPKSRQAVAVVEFAKQNGFDFTEDELEQAATSYAAASGKAISEDELANVVGGMSLSMQSFKTISFGGFSSNLLLNVHSLSSALRKFSAG